MKKVLVITLTIGVIALGGIVIQQVIDPPCNCIKQINVIDPPC